MRSHRFQAFPVALILLLAAGIFDSAYAVAAIDPLTVGVGKQYATPCAAIANAVDGNTILIDPNTYLGDTCKISQNNLTLKGNGGRPVINLNGATANQHKGIWVVVGNNITIENIEFKNATGPEENIAGIRQEGANLTIRYCYFHNNQNGIMGADISTTSLVIEYSEFAFNGIADGLTHNIYFGTGASFTMRYSYSHDANGGQLVKSRALKNYILYNRLTGQSNSNYEIDISQAGLGYVIGNLVQQSVSTANPIMFAYCLESGANPDHHLYVVNNTFVTAVSPGYMIYAGSQCNDGTFVVRNNIFNGTVQFGLPSGWVDDHNLKGTTNPLFVDPANYNYQLQAGSPAINAGTTPGTGYDGYSLNSAYQYLDAICGQARTSVSTFDIGAYEYNGGGTMLSCTPPPAPGITSTAPSNITNRSVTVTWTTDQPADTQVEYGATSSYGQSTTLDTSLVTAHSVTISSLSVTTTYHFRVKSKNAANNINVSGDYAFITASTPTITLSVVPQSFAVGVAYNQTVTASGGFGPYTFNRTSGSLPAGTVLNASGAIAGTPTTLGTVNFTIQAVDSAGNTGSRSYAINISNLVSGNLLFNYSGQTYDSAPFLGFVGRLSLNFVLTNNGPTIVSPAFFTVTQLTKLGAPVASPENVLLSADNGSGIVGDFQTLPVSSLGSHQSTPISFLVGIGSRQTFVIAGNVYGVLSGSPMTSVDNEVSKRMIDPAPTQGPVLLGRFQFEVSDATSDATPQVTPLQYSLGKYAVKEGAGVAQFDVVPITATGDPGGAPISNLAVISGPGAQSRPAVAVDPILPERMAMASNDYATGNVKVSTTQDAGRTWSTTTLSRSVLNQNFLTAQDPSLAFGSSGTLSIVYTLSNLANSSNAIAISESSDLVNFNPPVAITFHLSSDQIIDSRPAIAIKPHTGRYVAWDSLSTATFCFSVNLVRSEEGGLFGPVTTVAGDGLFSSASLAVSASTVYIGWDDWGFDSGPTFRTGGRLMIASSPTGTPLNFGTPYEIARTHIGFGQNVPAMPEQGAAPNIGLAVNPKEAGVVYAVFADRGNGMDILLARSGDSGRTWQISTVNNDATPADQFAPAIAVDSDGNLNISFDDTRLSPTFEAVDLFLARPSTGSSFDNQRISTVSSDDSRNNPSRDYTANLGDRTAIAVASKNAVIVWTDNRLGNEDIFTSVVAGKLKVISKTTITWNNPATIVYGTPLGLAQLNAAASAPGTLTYSPAIGTVLDTGIHTLSVTFAPADPTLFTAAGASVQINVQAARLTVTAVSTTRFYGSPNPPLTGSIAGLLNADNITAVYASNATVATLPGNYPIVPVLGDPNNRIPNYAVTVTNGTLTVIPSPIITLDAPNLLLPFGSQNFRSLSKPLKLTVGNAGTADLAIDRMALGGVNPSDFAMTTDCGKTVAVGRTCTINVTFTPVDFHGRSAKIMLTDNTGGYPGTQQNVDLSGVGVLTYAVYALSVDCGAITLSGKAPIDGDVATNGNVRLSGESSVKGAIYASSSDAGACKNGSPGITTSGNKPPAGSTFTVTPLNFTVPPSVAAGAVDVKVKQNGTALQPGSYRDISVDGDATLTLLPGTYNINSLKLTGDAKIAVAPGGRVTLNVAATKNPLDLTGGSIINASKDPANFVIIYSGNGEIDLTGKGDSSAIVYAPNAAVKLKGQTSWYGALVVQTLDVSGESAIHYDTSLNH